MTEEQNLDYQYDLPRDAVGDLTAFLCADRPAFVEMLLTWEPGVWHHLGLLEGEALTIVNEGLDEVRDLYASPELLPIEDLAIIWIPSPWREGIALVVVIEAGLASSKALVNRSFFDPSYTGPGWKLR